MPPPPPLPPHVAALLPPVAGLDVVELGCGQGDLVRSLHAAGAASVLGLELSPAALEEARRRGEPDGTRFEQSDLAQVTLTFASYDLVVCLRSTRPVPDPLRLTRVVNAGLRPGGVLLATVPAYAAAALTTAVTDARMELEAVEQVDGDAGPVTAVLARRRPPGPWMRTAPSPAGPHAAGPPTGRHHLA